MTFKEKFTKAANVEESKNVFFTDCETNADEATGFQPTSTLL